MERKKKELTQSGIFHFLQRHTATTKKKLHLHIFRLKIVSILNANRRSLEMWWLKDTQIYPWCNQISGFVELSISLYKNRWHPDDKLLERKKYWAKRNEQKAKRTKTKFHLKKKGSSSLIQIQAVVCVLNAHIQFLVRHLAFSRITENIPKIKFISFYRIYIYMYIFG